MADSAALPLSVFMSEKKKKQARAASPFPSIRDGVILWTLSHARNLIFSVAFATAYDMLFNHPPMRTVEMADAEVAVADDLALGMLWCAAPQAAAGALALMLPSHRRRLRLFLAYAALMATAASHCMLVALVRMFVAADLGDLLFKTVCITGIFAFVVGDLLCFLGLVLRGGGRSRDGTYGEEGSRSS